jgi:hypothetical protein
MVETNIVLAAAAAAVIMAAAAAEVLIKEIKLEAAVVEVDLHGPQGQLT